MVYSADAAGILPCCLWLWLRPVAQIGPLALELPYATYAALKSKKKKQKQKKSRRHRRTDSNPSIISQPPALNKTFKVSGTQFSHVKKEDLDYR